MEEESSKSTRANLKAREGKGDASFQAQGEFFKTLQEMSRDWMACVTAEVASGFKLSGNLITAHSVPDAIAAYGEWLNEEMGARSEDVRRLMSNGQKFLDTSSRIVSNGWMSTGTST
jgi:hypothetical protein